LLLPNAAAAPYEPNLVSTPFGLYDISLDATVLKDVGLIGDATVSSDATIAADAITQSSTGGNSTDHEIIDGVNWEIVTFLQNGTFTPVPATGHTTVSIQYAVVAGGGGGGGTGGATDDQGSGGGGGGGGVNRLLNTSAIPANYGAAVTASDYAVTIGSGGRAGGTGSPTILYQGANGDASTIIGSALSATAIGGGGGGSGRNPATHPGESDGLPGGSGGGSGRTSFIAAGNAAQGKAGNIGSFEASLGNPIDGQASAGGGGGGLTLQGKAAANEFKDYEDPETLEILSGWFGIGGDGGDGFGTAHFDADDFFGGGGGGGAGSGAAYPPGSTTGRGGKGGGGEGGYSSAIHPGSVNTGGGGGGAGASAGNTTLRPGGLGGSGNVHIRYRKFPDNPSAPKTVTLSGNLLTWTVPQYIPNWNGSQYVAGQTLMRYYVVYRKAGTDPWQTYARSATGTPLTITIMPTVTSCDANATNVTNGWDCLMIFGDLAPNQAYEFSVFGITSTLVGQINLDKDKSANPQYLYIPTYMYVP
jgi:hypothetical protein